MYKKFSGVGGYLRLASGLRLDVVSNCDCTWFHDAVAAGGTLSPALRLEKSEFSAGTRNSVAWVVISGLPQV